MATTRSARHIALLTGCSLAVMAAFAGSASAAFIWEGFQPLVPQTAQPGPGASVSPAQTQVKLPDDKDIRGGFTVTGVGRSKGDIPVSGMADDVPLKLALRGLAPAGTRVIMTKGVSPSMPVSWSGGRPWKVVLDDMLANFNMKAGMKGDTLVVFPAEAVPETAVAQAVDSKTSDKAGEGMPGEDAPRVEQKNDAAPTGAQLPADAPKSALAALGATAPAQAAPVQAAAAAPAAATAPRAVVDRETLRLGEPVAFSRDTTIKSLRDALALVTSVRVNLNETIPEGVAPGASAGPLVLGYVGTTRDLLDRVAEHYNAAWRYDKKTDQVEMSLVQTRDFEFAVLGGNAESALWRDMGSLVTGAVGNRGRVVVAPALGLISVTARPSEMRAVEQIIEKQNRKRTREISVSARVIQVSTDRDAASLGGRSASMEDALKVLAASGKVSALDAGAVTTLSDQAQSLKVRADGSNSLALDVTPRSIGDDRVLLKLDLDRASGSSGETLSQSSVLENGEVLVMPIREIRGYGRSVLMLLVSATTK